MKDQTGVTLTFTKQPTRIISLVPSLTETLYDIGLGDFILGVTKFCIHPPGLKNSVHIIGGTKNPKIKSIREIKPDLIIANKEENRLEDILVLKKVAPVYISDISNINDTISFLADVHKLFPQSSVEALLGKLESICNQTQVLPIKTCYLIWRLPWMTIGNDTFIHTMMETYGFENIFSNTKRYPVVTFEDLRLLQPSVIMLSSEPFPFKEKHIAEIKDVLPESKILLVDGEMFSWYGSRLLKADIYLKSLHKSIKSLLID
ncbi:MAG: ABC transporter substrate-binding protein [Saprospiraceae bacterium]|nr:ABC transporter substrate-binding protein [Saprospiraceae bacterium]